MFKAEVINEEVTVEVNGTVQSITEDVICVAFNVYKQLEENNTSMAEFFKSALIETINKFGGKENE